MSAKQYNLQPSKIFDATVSASTETDPTQIMNKDNVVYQLIWTGTLNASFAVHVSSDHDKLGVTPSWDVLPLDPAPVASGSAGSWTIDLNQIGSKWAKLVITRNSGSGNLKVYVSGKAI